jgi:hypothetical protein
MQVRIKTKNGAEYDFGISSSKYFVFAQVIAGGDAEWEICLVPGKPEEGSLEDGFHAEGWAKASRDVQEYLKKLNIPEFIKLMRLYACPGDHLEYFMKNHVIPVG